MITFVDERGCIVAVTQDLYEFSYYYQRGHYFILDGIIHSPADYGAVARAIAKLLAKTTIIHAEEVAS